MSNSAFKDRPDYASIIRNTLFLGGGSVVNLLIGLVRTKVIAVLLGPQGIALFGVFSQLVEILRSTFSLGLGTSGIRQIAASHSVGDEERVSRIVRTLRRTTIITGGLGALFTVAASGWLAEFTFGEYNSTQQVAIAILGVAVFLLAVKTGQDCVVSATRRLDLYMRISLGGSIASVVTAIPFVYYLGIAGVAPAVVASFGSSFLVSWWYSRQIPLAQSSLSVVDAKKEAKQLLALGLPIMATGILGTISPYLERVIILRYIGIDQLGQYQAAFALAGVSVTLVLGVMSADFYPRLVAHAEKPSRFDAELNAQIEVAILFAMPVLVALSAFSSTWIQLIYTNQFTPASEVLAIMSIGVIGRIVVSPIRMALLAKHKGKTGFGVELVTTSLGLALVLFFAPSLGLVGCAWAFTLLHMCSALLITLTLPWLSGQKVNARTYLLAGSATALISSPYLVKLLVVDSSARTAILAIVVLVAAFYSFKKLKAFKSKNNDHA